jgi:hypothetical protein
MARDKFKLSVQPIPDTDQRITRIAAEHCRTGQTSTAGLLFTGDMDAHDVVRRELQQLADRFGLPSGHWHRQSEADGIPTFCIGPDPDGDDAWPKFAADYGVPSDLVGTTLLASPVNSDAPARYVA